MENIKKTIEGIQFGVGFFLTLIVLYNVYGFTAPGSGPTTDYYVDTSSPLIDNITRIKDNIYMINRVAYQSSTTASDNFPPESCPTGFTIVENYTYTTLQARASQFTWDDWTLTLCRKN